MSGPREHFDLPEGVYLLSHSAGCLPKAARTAAGEFFTAWGGKGGEAWGDWLGGIWRFREELAGLLNARAEDFCPQPNLSSALTKIIGALPRRPGRTDIAYSELDFPSLGFVCQQASRGFGYEARMIAAASGEVPPEAWEAALGGGVQLAHITHVFSENSRRQPVAEILALCRERGIYSVVDIAQSVGVVPIDISAWDADFVTGSCLKWLCGGPGAGFLWANPRIVDRLHPPDVGWFSHADPFEFDITHFAYREGALRYWGGTPSVLPYAIAAASIGVLRGIGLETVRAANLAHTARIIAAAEELGLAISTPLPEPERGGTVALRFADSAAAAQALGAAGFCCDWRPRSGVRLSPHVYNTEGELDSLCAELRLGLGV